MNGTSFEDYIECTVCTTVRPVSRAGPGYPGPKQAGPDGERLRLEDGILYDGTLKYCINCKRYRVAHPSDVKIGDVIQRARAKHDITHPSLHSFVLSYIDLMGSVSTPLAPIANTVTSLRPVWQLLDAVSRVDHRRTPPKYSFDALRRWYRSVAAQQAQYEDQVTSFHGCFVNYDHPQLGKDLIKVLSATGIGVQLSSREKCCGVPLIANDFTDKARRQAITNVESIHEAMGVKDISAIAISSMYTFTLCDEYLGVLNIDNKDLRDHIELAIRWLWRKLDGGRTLPLKLLPPKVVYHAPCHIEKVGWTFYTLELLRKIPGPELTMLDSRCCNITGTYGLKKENYPTLQTVGAPLFHQIEESDADLVVTDCETCKWQIETSTSLRCEHSITLLAQTPA